MTARSRRCGSVTRAGRRCLRSCTGGRVRCPVHRLAVYNTRGGREEQAREDGEDSRRRALARLEEMRRSRNSSASYDPGPSTRTKPTLGAPPGPGPEQTLWDRMMGEPEVVDRILKEVYKFDNRNVNLALEGLTTLDKASNVAMYERGVRNAKSVQEREAQILDNQPFLKRKEEADDVEMLIRMAKERRSLAARDPEAMGLGDSEPAPPGWVDIWDKGQLVLVPKSIHRAVERLGKLQADANVYAARVRSSYKESLRNKRSADRYVDRATDRLTNAKRRAGREWEWRPGARRPTFGDLQQHDAITRAIAEGLDTRSAIRFGSTSRKNNLVTSQVLKGRFAAAADRAQKRATQKMPGF
eukprot:jgi/Mesvir1/25918/Mv13703-RA.1